MPPTCGALVCNGKLELGLRVPYSVGALRSCLRMGRKRLKTRKKACHEKLALGIGVKMLVITILTVLNADAC
jgi:hypothetical protein